MIKEDDLSVVVALDFHALGSITRRVHIRIHIYYFSVSLISKEKSLVVVGIHPEIGRVVQGWVLRIPVEETQVSRLWKQLPFSFIISLEILGFEPVSQIDIPADLIVALLLLPDENNCGHAAAADVSFAVGDGFQEIRVVDFATCMSWSFGLLGVLLLLHLVECLLLGLELVPGHDVALGHHPDLVQHVRQFLVLQVEQVLLVHH